jgi:signal transduction histidine kinase
MIVVNGALAALFAAILATETGTLAADHQNVALRCAAGLVMCGAAVLRARSRAWTAVIGLGTALAAEVAASLWHLPGEPGIAATLALFVLTGSALLALPVRPAAAVAVAAAAIAAVETRTHPAAVAPLILGWVVTAAVVGWLRVWLPLRAARRQAAIDDVRRTERLELARELHDTAAHHLTGIVIQAQAARIALRTSPQALDTALSAIESGGADALIAMRRVIGLLRNEAGDTDGRAPGPPRLTDLVRSYAGQPGPAIRLDGAPDPAWPAELAVTIYRVVQEALTNVTRHASDATEAIVTLAHDRRAITVEITDNAPPQTTRFPHASGYGLIGLRERVETLGGIFAAGPGATGWSVRATLPTS